MGLGAFNDNFFRQALISMLAFGALGLSNQERSMFGSLATGLMILPFFLFSALAGQLADRLSKSLMLKVTKGAEMVLMLVAAALFIYGDFKLLILLLFLMGTQSAFFGPIKYGLLPEVLDQRDLVAGNGLVGGFSFLAIVLGTMAGSYLINIGSGPVVWVPSCLFLAAGIGFLISLRQPTSHQADREIKVDPMIWRSTIEIIGSVKRRDELWLAILAISWFWGMGSILLTQLPVLAATSMGATPAVGTFLVTTMALGVAIGSLGVQRLLRGRVSAVLAPVSAFILTVLMTAMALVILNLPNAPAGTVTLKDFFQIPIYIGLGLLCLGVSTAGGVFVVPLNALLQHRAGDTERARVIAANNIINSLFMASGNILVMLLVWAGFSTATVFFVVAASALAVTILTAFFLPEAVIKSLAKIILAVFYRPKLKGLEHLEAVGVGPVLIIPNHTSFADVALLVAYFPRRLTFAIDVYRAQAWWVKLFLSVFRTIPVNPAQPLATRELIAALERGEAVVIFPEGRLTTTGSIMKVYDGPGLVASHCICPLLPVIFHGLEYTRFGKLRRLMRNRPKKFEVSMTIMEPVVLGDERSPGESRRNYRHRVTGQIYEIMVQSMFKSRHYKLNVYDALTKAAASFGYSRVVFEDYTRRKVTYRYLIRLAKVLGHFFRSRTKPGENVGILLPNSSPLISLAFGLWAGARVPVMLNYSQGHQPLVSALTAAAVKIVITSRSFIQNAHLEDLIKDIPAQLIYLDETKISFFQKIFGLMWRPRPAKPDTPAAVLFTSGSEGHPKGVVLSHQNMISNIWQARSLIEINEDDVLFNPMPAFHAFGFNVGMILPLISGMRSYSHLSPLHVKDIPELIYDTRATVVIGGDTFAAAWARNAHPYDFCHVNFMLLGAEKLKPTTLDIYFRKLSIRLFEGYGVTEGAPILAVASRMRVKDGTVGHILPGIEYRLAEVQGMTEGGRLEVRGPNLLMGYLSAQNPGVLQARSPDDWYDTGDICVIDDEGFVKIVGRFKRFAKISGEMISLAAVEEVAFRLWPGQLLAILARPDQARGEALLLVYQGDFKPDLDLLRRAIREQGFSDLTVPRMTLQLDNIPLTPLCKIDYPALQTKVDELSKSAAPALSAQPRFFSAAPGEEETLS
jgi:acyl-[acyl-carrier-protein]-phospholipid O-acyltransferase/long-chain-fatty-acid--[acyl-carrier-protein] ligase